MANHIIVNVGKLDGRRLKMLNVAILILDRSLTYGNPVKTLFCTSCYTFKEIKEMLTLQIQYNITKWQKVS